MSVFAAYLVRDEADIVKATIGRMVEEVDKVVVLDHGSVDGTREILAELEVEVLDDGEPAHWQSRKMSWLAQRAAAEGADWVLACDADERWYSPHGRIADVLAKLRGSIAPAWIFNHRATSSGSPSGDPLVDMPWREREALPLHKIACRPALPVTIGEGNHVASYPSQEPVWDQLVIRHYPYRSVEQFVRKVRNGRAALEATSLPEEVGTHWRDYGRILDSQGEDGIAEIFFNHFFSAEPESDPALIFDPAP